MGILGRPLAWTGSDLLHVPENLVHLFQCLPLGLREEQSNQDTVDEVQDDE
jgi:hypothetical protein